MHARMLVTFTKEKARTSQGARKYAYTVLSQDDSFVGDGGRFGSPLADWFVIGGRWSGELTRMRLDQEKLKQLDAAFEQQHGWWLGGKEQVTEDIRREQYRALFLQYFPDFVGEVPAWRDAYSHLGDSDDAAVVDEKLYDTALKEYEGQDTDGEFFADLDGECVNSTFVGKKWIVVVDYHC